MVVELVVDVGVALIIVCLFISLKINYFKNKIFKILELVVVVLVVLDVVVLVVDAISRYKSISIYFLFID